MSQSVYHAQLDPPVGTLYWKSCTTDTLKHSFDSTDGQGKSTGKGYVIEWKITFHIYVTCQPATDDSFTKNGGKVYIVGVVSGLVYPDWGWKDTPDDLNYFKVSIFQDTNMDSVPVVTVLPNTTSELKDGDNNRYNVDYQQTMSMYRFDNDEYVNFVAQYQETFTRVGYKQSTEWQYPRTELAVVRDDKASDHDSKPKVKGLVIWEANSLRKVDLLLGCVASWGHESPGYQTDSYELDFSADNWVTDADPKT